MLSEKNFKILIVLSMCIWGMSWASAKVLTSYGSPSALALIRFALVPLTLYPVAKILKIDISIKKEGIIYAVGAGFFMMLYTLFFFKGLSEGLPGKGGVLVTTLNPIFAYLLGLLISKVLPSKLEFIGLLIGFAAGCVLLPIWHKMDAILDFGNANFLLAAFIWAVMSKISSHSKRFGNIFGFSIWMHLITVFGLLFVTDLNEVKDILVNGDTKFWLNILYFGIINSSLATSAYLYATSVIGAEKASSYIFIVPSMAILTSWLVLGEQVQWYTIVGGALGIIAVFCINGAFTNFIVNKKDVNK